MVILMLSGHKFSLQNAVSKFFSRLGEVFTTPTGSAYCQAKQKVKAEVFVHLNQVLTVDFYQLYEAEGAVRRWHGHRLLGADGTNFNVPENEETKKIFSLHSNHKSGEKSKRLQALGMVLYDLLNDLGIKGAMTKSHCWENHLMMQELWEEVEVSDVLVIDRGKCSYYLVAKAKAEKKELIMRMPKGKFRVVDDFWESSKKDEIIKLSGHRSNAVKQVKAENLPLEVEVRLVKFRLESGEEEVLLTTFLDQEEYPRQEFYQVYGWRWKDETYYDRIKNVFELERFSGQSEESIRQDFYGVIFLASLESIISREVEEEIREEAIERKTETEPQVNHAVSYVALIERVGNLLADKQKNVEEVLKELEHLFRQNPTRKRDGRKYPREVITHARKLKYHRYTKRIIA